jgi:hypothetical protein
LLSRFALGLTLAALLFIRLLASAPARLLGLVLPADTLVMQGFSGSVWRGSAANALVDAGHGYIQLGRVSWRLAPLSLLILSPEFELDSRWGGQVFSAQITLHDAQNIEFHDLDATVSAGLLRQFSPLQVAGQFSTQWSHLAIREGLPFAGEGRIIWQEAAWLSPQGAQPLGSYALTLKQEEGQALFGDVVTVTGPVEASGNIRLQGRVYEVDILLDDSSGLDAELRQALSLLAQPVAQGYRIQLNGEF